MDVVGTGRRLATNDIGELARQLGVPTPALLAIIEIESAGKGFDAKNRPTMLTEGHVFYRELPEAQRTSAVSKGLAWKRWGDKPYPKSFDARWALWHQWRLFNLLAGSRSASYGMFQIMGFNAWDCGFASADLMLEAAKLGEKQQVQMAGTLIRTWKLIAGLQNIDLTKADNWRPFAKRWNGSGYAKNNYHVKLANAFIKHEKRKNEYAVIKPTSPVEQLLIKGLKGEHVLNLQKDLEELGYNFTLGVDGRFGDETEKLVKAFQQKAGLAVDGKVGAITQAAIDRALSTVVEAMIPKVVTSKSFWDTLVEFVARLFSSNRS